MKIAVVHSGGEKSDCCTPRKSAVKDITGQYYKKVEYKKLSKKQKWKLAMGNMVSNSFSASLQVDAIDLTDNENFGWLLESN